MSKYPLTNGNYAEAVIQVGTDGNPVSVGGGGGSSVSLNSGTNFIGRTGARAFRVTDNFIRPANITAYTVNDAITNSVTAPSVRSVDLAPFGAVNGQSYQIVNCRVISSAAQVTLPQVNVIIFNTTFTATNDNSPLVISAAIAQTGGIVIPCLNTYNFVNSSRCVSDPSAYIGTLGASSTQLFFSLQAANAYSPVNSERFDIVFEGYLL